MLKAIIVDDEQPAIDLLKKLIDKIHEIEYVGSFLNAYEALENLANLHPDIAFLDIQMPGMNGLELASKMLKTDIDIEIIFVTAYDQYALEAFRVNARNYLLKPVLLEDIQETVMRILKRRGDIRNYYTAGRIYGFGKFLVHGNNNESLIKWRTSKSEELFAFFMHNRNAEMPKWKICEALWPDCNYDKVNIYLHTTIYKMKKTLLDADIKIEIKFRNGCYSIKLPQLYYDIDEFVAITKKKITSDEQLIKQYEKALLLYKNDYLEGNDYLWCMSKREQYFSDFYNIAKILTQYYVKEKKYNEAKRVILRMLENNNLDENVHEMLLRLYMLQKDRYSFIIHYHEMERLLFTELGITPRESVKKIYKTFITSI